VARAGAALAAGALFAAGVAPASFGQEGKSFDPIPSTKSHIKECNRRCLEGFVDKYFKAVIDDAPAEAPLAPNVRFTENGQRLPLGEGLWKSMKAAGKYRLLVTDPDAGQIALITTVVEDARDPNGGAPALMALRLKVDGGKITEIEQILNRDTATPGPQGKPLPTAAERVEALGQPRKAFLTKIPKKDREPRAEIIAQADKYFTGMQMNDGKGDYPFGDRCNRIENGGQSTNVPPPPGQTPPDPKTATGYSAQWTCMQQFKSGLLHFVSRIRDRRWVAVDQERGIAAAFAFFDHEAGSTRTFQTPDGRTITAGPTSPWTWEILEIFKVEKGKIQEIEAFLNRPPYGMNSGWSSWEDGLSDKTRDVTGFKEEQGATASRSLGSAAGAP
jgi:hypothetical protein